MDRIATVLLTMCVAGVPYLPKEMRNQAIQGAGQVSLSQPLAVLWQYASNQTMDLTPAAEGDRIYLPLSSGTLVSLRKADGKLFWKTEIGGELSVSPVADRKAVYVASQPASNSQAQLSPNGVLRALGREAGITLWTRTLESPIRAALTISGETIFTGAMDGRIYSLKKTNGEIRWVVQYSSPISSSAAAANSRVFVGSDDGSLLALDESTGRMLWRYRTRGAIRGVPVVSAGTVYFGSADGNVYAVSEGNGLARWRARTGAAVQGVAASDGGLLVTSLDDFVYFLSLSRGTLLWKHQLDGRLISQPLTSSDSALFTPLSGDSSIVLALRDGKTLNNIPLGEDNATGAAPVLAGNLLLLTTRHGLLAFSQSHSPPE